MTWRSSRMPARLSARSIKGARPARWVMLPSLPSIPNKQMTTGEGGMIVTDNDDWARLFRSLRNQGRDVFDAWLNHTRLGYNYRLDELSAALGLAQLQRIEELLAKRERVAGWYNERLGGSGLIKPVIHRSHHHPHELVRLCRTDAGRPPIADHTHVQAG